MGTTAGGGLGLVERSGGWDTVRGVLLVAGLVALPLAPPLAAVVARWLPVAGEPPAVAAVAVFTWLALTSWFLRGALAHLRPAAAGAAARAPARGATGARLPAARSGARPGARGGLDRAA